MPLSVFVDWIQCLLGLSIVVQSMELLVGRDLRKSWSDRGVWRSRWVMEGVRADLPLLYPVWAWMRAPSFFVILVLRLICGGVLGVSVIFEMSSGVMGVVVGWTVLSTLLIGVRWRGTFNGGSDVMTFQVAFGLLLWQLGTESNRHWGVVWIGVQGTLSYFVAGWVKVAHREWWTGLALRRILSNTAYAIPPVAQGWASQERWHWAFAAATWVMLVFELSSPVMIWMPGMPDVLRVGFLVIGIGFHFANFVFFGLNRFFWAWLSVYPAFLALMR